MCTFVPSHGHCNIKQPFFSLRISWTSEADEGFPVLALCLKAAADAVTSAPSRQFRCSEQAAAAYLASQNSETGHQGQGEHIKVVHTQSVQSTCVVGRVASDLLRVSQLQVLPDKKAMTR